MKIPVIINNRNLLTYPKQMLERIKEFDDVGEVYILDNGSTYEPLLRWYNTNPCNIIKTDNKGYLSVWINKIPQLLNLTYYVVTDPDLDLDKTPKDCLTYLLDKLKTNKIYDKIGLSLKNWDVPSESPYHEFLRNWALTNWNPERIIDGLLVDQKFDTTFGIYDINRNPRGNSCATYSPYSADHIPWSFTHNQIKNMENENYEYFFYLMNSNSSSSYKSFIKFK